jgi:hypothetical protein
MPDHDDPKDVLGSPQLIEELAAIEHERWSHWQRYLHAQCEPRVDGSLAIPADLVYQWTLQMNTPYAELSEKEKDSDREQVHRYLPTIAAALKVDRA